EEEAKELLEVITAERLETEQQQKLEQQEQLSIEKLRLEIELSRNANQSATQNNGQTSRVKSLDEIVKMVRLLTVKVPNKSDGWDYFFSSLEKAFASENVSDELKPKVLLCMLGDKVSNLLVNLGEEELKDYESLKQVHALVDSGTKEITVIKKVLVPGTSVEGASTIYLKGIFGPAVECPLVYVPIGLATGCRLMWCTSKCYVRCVVLEDVASTSDVLDMLGGAQSEEEFTGSKLGT
ncbi:retrovirus-related Pol polyprotein from transposon opus, partial [Trichonephila clavipes]